MEYGDSFDMIFHAGNAKDEILNALHAARKKEMQTSHSHMELAQKEINAAHACHSQYLVRISNGEEIQPDLIMMHAQDHLNSAMTIQILVIEMIAMIQEGVLSNAGRI